MRKYLPAVITFLCLLIITLAIFTISHSRINSNFQVEFDRFAKTRTVSLQRALKEKYLILESMRVLYTTYNGVPQPEFSQMARPYVEELEGIQGYRWVVPVLSEARTEFEEGMWSFGFSNFQIVEYGDTGQLIPALPRPIHYPILPIPDDSSELTDGFDLASNPQRLAALERAISSGQLTTSGRIPLMEREAPDSYAFLAFAPVYLDTGNGQEISGLVTGVFSIPEIVESAISLLEPQAINFLLEDSHANQGEEFLYLQSGRLPKGDFRASWFPEFTPQTYQEEFPVGDKIWSITASPGANYMLDKQSDLPWTLLLTGIISASFLSIYFAVYIKQSNKIQQNQKELSEMQTQLFRTQKVEAIGQLASGIAHDFNNILTGILGYSVLAKEKVENGNDQVIINYLSEVIKAGTRGQDLIKKLSTFTRNTPSSSSLQDLSALTSDALDLLRPAMTSNILITFNVEEDLPQVKVDPTNFEQIVMNLCINARDAITEHNHNRSGNISLALKIQMLNKVECASCHKLVTGEYVVLSVTDSGGGIDESVLQDIFNPFFSTKEPGKGTGMGLSIIHGIVHSYGGHILLESTIDQGTTFKIFFPILALK